MNKEKKLYLSLIIVFILFSLAVFITNYYGETDTRSFTSTAKFFAGSYQAKIRSSHSYLWGFVNFPLVKLFQNYIGFKILNLIILTLIIISIYYISNKKDKKLLFLLLCTPILWYMAPYVNSIQIASLFFLWCYYFIQKYDDDGKISYLIYSGIFFGLAVAFWHAIFFYGIFLIMFFFYDKKVFHLLYYIIAILIGLIPLFILDYYIFVFIFHSLIKNYIGTMSNLLSLGIYSVDATASKTIPVLFVVIVMLPFYVWKLYTKKVFKKHKKVILFLTAALLITLKNPQARYLLLIVPIILIILLKILDKNQIKRLLLISMLVTTLTIISYVVILPAEEIRTKDLIQIDKDYSNELFLIGPYADDYERIAILSWDNNISEFISIQDYELYLNNESSLIERELRFTPIINSRREYWISGGIGKPISDNTDYESINYLIDYGHSCDEIIIDNFILDKHYQILSVYKKAEEITNE